MLNSYQISPKIDDIVNGTFFSNLHANLHANLHGTLRSNFAFRNFQCKRMVICKLGVQVYMQQALQLYFQLNAFIVVDICDFRNCLLLPIKWSLWADVYLHVGYVQFRYTYSFIIVLLTTSSSLCNTVAKHCSCHSLSATAEFFGLWVYPCRVMMIVQKNRQSDSRQYRSKLSADAIAKRQF